MRVGGTALAYAEQGHDRMREELEEGFFARLVPSLLAASGGSSLLDLGCGDCLVQRLAGERLERYRGVDLRLPAKDAPGCVQHDLRDGLGPVGRRPYGLYLATFGVASHLAPAELRRLLAEVAAHARPGAIVALEALGLYSLEWPQLWERKDGEERVMHYRLGADVPVHPWAPGELAGLFEQAGIRPLRALDRTVQAGPKTGAAGYWPGLPPLRRTMNELLAGEHGVLSTALAQALPPLPAGRAALLHHALAARRRRVVERLDGTGARLARAVWGLEPRSGGGFGHGLTVVGRVT